MNKLSGWKLAWLIAWVCILGLLGVTVAEMSFYTGIVQFYGESLFFSWEDDENCHHYRATVSSNDLTVTNPEEIQSVYYTDAKELEIDAQPGYIYQVHVQGLSSAGNASLTSYPSPQYLCLGYNPGDLPVPGLAAFLPQKTALNTNYPNHFNASTTIPYTIGNDQGAAVDASLKIYNTLGQLVRTVVEDNKVPGQYHAVWDGRNASGAVVSAGSYVCLLTAGDFSETKLMIFLK
ncbi:MAG: FlgD immunoglobulin-like domain containing protein [bacterium]